jgi:predicted nucleic-acid-binding Zn-ribbon protein
MMKQGKCPKCGSCRVIHDARLIDRNGEYPDASFSVRIETKPEALLFKGAKDFELQAHVCGTCGYAELYAADPGALWQACVSSRTRSS